MNNIFKLFSFLPLKEHESLQRWYKVSLIFLSLLMISLLTITCMQWWQLRTLHAQKNNVHSAINFSQLVYKKDSLEKQKEMYILQLDELKKMRESTNQIHDFLNYIAHIIPEDVALNQILYHRNQEFLITGRSRSLVCLNQFVELIKKNNLRKNVMVNSIHQSIENNQSFITFKIIVSQ